MLCQSTKERHYIFVNEAKQTLSLWYWIGDAQINFPCDCHPMIQLFNQFLSSSLHMCLCITTLSLLYCKLSFGSLHKVVKQLHQHSWQITGVCFHIQLKPQLCSEKFMLGPPGSFQRSQRLVFNQDLCWCSYRSGPLKKQSWGGGALQTLMSLKHGPICI